MGVIDLYSIYLYFRIAHFLRESNEKQTSQNYRLRDTAISARETLIIIQTKRYKIHTKQARFARNNSTHTRKNN